MNLAAEPLRMMAQLLLVQFCLPLRTLFIAVSHILIDVNFICLIGTFFSTHYFALCDLVRDNPQVRLAHMVRSCTSILVVLKKLSF